MPAPPAFRWVPALAALALAALALAGCGGGDSESQIGELKTSGSTYRITKVELTDRYPVGCGDSCLIGPPGSSSSNRLRAGTQLVAVTVEAVEGAARLGSGCPGESIYVVAEDGSRHTCTALGSKGGEESRLDLLFSVPQSAKGFTLHAPGAAPVELGK